VRQRSQDPLRLVPSQQRERRAEAFGPSKDQNAAPEVGGLQLAARLPARVPNAGFPRDGGRQRAEDEHRSGPPAEPQPPRLRDAFSFKLCIAAEQLSSAICCIVGKSISVSCFEIVEP
jgi:hypothetical protein